MATSPDSFPVCSPDTERPTAGSLDPRGALDAFAVSLGAAVELFLGAKAAEGASPRTIEWYRMILVRLVRSIGQDRAVDGLDPAELRAWLVELRTTLAPVSVAGYVRTLRVLGKWLPAEGLAQAAALRGLRRPRVPHKVIEPVADDVLRRLLSICSVRDRAIVLLMLDTGLRVSEVASIRLGDLRPDGTLKVYGKGSRERMVPVGSTARQAILPLPRPAWPGEARRRAVPRSAGRDQRPRPPAHGPAAQEPGRGDRAAEPTLAAAQFCPELSREPRRRVQPRADPRPHDARHGQALRRPRRRRPRDSPRRGLAG